MLLQPAIRESQELQFIAFERHESGIFRDQSFDSKGEKMEPVKIGTHFKSDSFSRVTQIINPVDNVNGVVIRTGVFSGSGGGSVQTGTAAPMYPYDTTKPVIARLEQTASYLQYPIEIPAGHGLWVSPNPSGYVWITYDLL
ncbi:hypothetical protein [Pseudomonas sp. QD4]|uniref:hypothetical protein n=1 Tax=Pseudomonas sp. QD4 TaxID=3368618 RepID=UPI003BA09409